MATDDDWTELFRAGLAGDGRAYARFLQVVTPVLRGIVRAKGPSLGPEAHEDIVQDILLAIHLKRQTWRPDSPVRPWLYAIARHKVVDAFRARGNRTELQIEDFAEILPAEPGADPTERGDVLKVLSRLDPRSAEVLRAIGVDGEEVGEAGRRLGMSDVAVRVAFHRGLKRLAELRERWTG